MQEIIVVLPIGILTMRTEFPLNKPGLGQNALSRDVTLHFRGCWIAYFRNARFHLFAGQIEFVHTPPPELTLRSFRSDCSL